MRKTSERAPYQFEQKAGDGEGGAITIVDEYALLRTEAGASRILASRCADALLDEWEQAVRNRDGRTSGADLAAKLRAEREIVSRFLFQYPRKGAQSDLTKEQERQVTRRILRQCAGYGARLQTAAVI